MKKRKVFIKKEDVEKFSDIINEIEIMFTGFYKPCFEKHYQKLLGVIINHTCTFILAISLGEDGTIFPDMEMKPSEKKLIAYQDKVSKAKKKILDLLELNWSSGKNSPPKDAEIYNILWDLDLNQ